MRTRDILRKAANLIETVGWTTGTLARKSADSGITHPCDPEAKCFCAIGAVCRVMGIDQWTDPNVIKVLSKFDFFIVDKKLMHFNYYSMRTSDIFYRVSRFNATVPSKDRVVSALRKCANTYESNSK